MIVQSIQLSSTAFALSGGIAESGFGSNFFLVFEVAHDAQPKEGKIHGG